jgi:YHS domain-containing protein
MRINESEAKAERVYRGRRFLFSSTANAEAFDGLPEVYSAVPSRESLVCPVMKNPIASHAAASGYSDHGGVRYYFCCAGCEKPFEQDPSRYVAAVAGSIRSLSPAQSGKEPQVGIVPTCAGCAGEARILGANGIPAKWTLSYRWVNIDTEIGARHRFTLDYAVNPRLSVGIERALSDRHHHNKREGSLDRYLRYSDGETDLMPRAAWFITPERPQHPSLVVGMASDRLSTVRGQAFYLTAAKKVPGTIFTPFVSVKTNSYDGRTLFPFGINASLRPDWVVQAINDGDYSHFLLTHVRQGAAYSVLWARGRHLGFGVTYGF